VKNFQEQAATARFGWQKHLQTPDDDASIANRWIINLLCGRVQKRRRRICGYKVGPEKDFENQEKRLGESLKKCRQTVSGVP
jgi:hypothetical protein